MLSVSTNTPSLSTTGSAEMFCTAEPRITAQTHRYSRSSLLTHYSPHSPLPPAYLVGHDSEAVDDFVRVLDRDDGLQLRLELAHADVQDRAQPRRVLAEQRHEHRLSHEADDRVLQTVIGLRIETWC